MSEQELNQRSPLLLDQRCGYDALDESGRAALEDYCKAYLRFVGEAKTEREAVRWVTAAAREAGSRDFDPDAALSPGYKI